FSSFALGTKGADAAILAGTAPRAFEDAYQFTQDVENYLQQHHLGADHIYLTGHSLGGAEAEYVGSLDHESGVTFGAPGVPGNHGSLVANQSFVNYVDYGDPVGNFGSHFGNVEHVGSPVGGVVTLGLIGAFGAVEGQLLAGLLFHGLPHYAQDL